ncbi:MAG: helix-turn-helix transcriptional regulator [Phycisphaerales bacterium]|nr:helix-turn-helix transcriptional regulator [Phycisphaerales bacterium]
MATARAARQIGQLPGAPTPDWATRAAEILAEADPATRTEVVIGVVRSTGPLTECRGSAIGGWVPSEESSDAPRGRRLCRSLLAALAPERRCGVWRIHDLLGPDAARRLSGSDEPVLAAWVPVPHSDPGAVRALLAVWGAPGGSIGMSPEARERILKSLLPLLAERVTTAIGRAEGRGSWLSAGEHRVLELLTSGLTVQEIADRLGRSQHTIHDHVKRIHRKLGTRSRGSLIARTLGTWQPPRPKRRTFAFPLVGRGCFVDHAGW